jgi:Cu+-exporting ATPase
LSFSKNPEQYIRHQPTTAIDPVCQMTVEISSTQYTSESDGSTYYFCCAGCKTAFDKKPQDFAIAKNV